MLFSVEQAFVGRDEKRAPLKRPAWEATKYHQENEFGFFKLNLVYCAPLNLSFVRRIFLEFNTRGFFSSTKGKKENIGIHVFTSINPRRRAILLYIPHPPPPGIFIARAGFILERGLA